MKNISGQTKFNLAILVLLLAILIYQIVLDQKIERITQNVEKALNSASSADYNTEQIKEKLNIYD